MNMPGFTAEASLERASRGYQVSRSSDAPTGSRAVLPQVGRPPNFWCYRECMMDVGLPAYCSELCRGSIRPW
jgi:hypothetical protein